MLQLLHIENIAVIERADISFRAGFNALTGETGAGKSIVIDSLGAVLGARTSRDLIRTGEVSAAASAISKWPAVRRRMVAAQREIAATADMLIDGRDIGTRVLIDAPVKIFLTATPEERARRRYRQQIEKGDMTPYEQVLAELNARDAQDMNRETDPLRQAEDAVLVDSTNMTPEQVVDAIIAVVEDVYGKRA